MKFQAALLTCLGLVVPNKGIFIEYRTGSLLTTTKANLFSLPADTVARLNVVVDNLSADSGYYFKIKTYSLGRIIYSDSVYNMSLRPARPVISLNARATL